MFDAVEEDHDNIRNALGWALHGDRVHGLQAVESLFWFWHERGYWIEARDWRDRYLCDRSGLPAALVGRTLTGSVFTHAQLGLHGRAKGAADEAKSIAAQTDDAEGMAGATYMAALAGWFAGGTISAALRDLEDALERSRALDHRPGIAHALVAITSFVVMSRDVTRGARLNREASALAREVGNVSAVSYLAFYQGWNEANRRNFDLAEELLDEAFVLHRAIRNPHHQDINRRQRGLLSGARGDYASAYAYHEGRIPLCRRLAQSVNLAQTYTWTGMWARMLGRHADADAHYADATALYTELRADRGRLPIDLARADLCLAQEDAAGATGHLMSAYAALGNAEPHHTGSGLLCVARLSRLNGSPQLACRLLTYVDERRRSAGTELDPLWHLVRVHEDLADELRRQLRKDVTVEEYSAATEAGPRMSPDEAMALARGQLNL